MAMRRYKSGSKLPHSIPAPMDAALSVTFAGVQASLSRESVCVEFWVLS
jgi:hypothetical protein